MKQIPKTLKFLAVFLVFAFCLQILPQMVLRTWAEEIADAFATEQTVIETEDSETVVLEPEEIVARRTETAKHFRMPDGTVLAADYSLPVHYEKDGQWVDIDNTLSPEDGEYITENEFTVRFAENGNSHKLLELSKDGYSIRFGISPSAKSSSGAVDFVMDAAYAPISYGYIGRLPGRLTRTVLNGVVDGIIDVFQVSYIARGKAR